MKRSSSILKLFLSRVLSVVDIVDCNVITLTEAVIKRLSFQGKNINTQAHLFNKTVINICHNYIPNKYATFMDENSPWLNDHIRFLIKKKNAAFQKYLKDEKTNVKYSTNK